MARKEEARRWNGNRKSTCDAQTSDQARNGDRDEHGCLEGRRSMQDIGPVAQHWLSIVGSGGRIAVRNRDEAAE